jgi:hypothetical protein
MSWTAQAALGGGGCTIGAAGAGLAASFVVPTHGVSAGIVTVRASGRLHSSAERPVTLRT